MNSIEEYEVNKSSLAPPEIAKILATYSDPPPPPPIEDPKILFVCAIVAKSSTSISLFPAINSLNYLIPVPNI
jgi:hypothetical protein